LRRGEDIAGEVHLLHFPYRPQLRKNSIVSLLCSCGI
jgi:hypothetical protein